MARILARLPRTARISFRAAAAAAAVLGPPGLAAAQQPLHSVLGSGLGGRLGASVIACADVNGDGQPDFAAGAPFDDTAGVDAGAVRFFSGTTGAEIPLKAIYGQAPGDRLGHAMIATSPGALVVSAPFADANGADSGRVYFVDPVSGGFTNIVGGSVAGDRLGWSLANLPIGTTPYLIAVGAPYADTLAVDGGRVYVLTAAGALSLFPTILAGTQASQHFGWSVSGGCTVLFDASLTARLAVGSPDYDGAAGANAGRVDRYLGTATSPSPILSLSDTWHGPSSGERFGAAVLETTPLDATVYFSYVVGSPSFSSSRGKITALSGIGPLLYTAQGLATGSELGASLASVGNIAQSVVTELAVGAPGAANAGATVGQVWVLDGSNGALLSTLSGTVTGGRFGESISYVGDWNGDLAKDLLIGAPDVDLPANDSGNVQIRALLTGSLVRSADGPARGDHLGRSLASVGDIDGDGAGDWIAGGPAASRVVSFPFPSVTHGTGMVRLVSGATGASVRLHYGSGSGEELGWSVAGVADLDLDGVPDYAAGAPQRASSSLAPGLARIYSGATGGALFTLAGTSNGMEAGYSVAGIGDVTLDARPDVAVGAPASTNGTLLTFSGASGLLVGSVQGGAAGERFGHAVAGLGADVSGDGRPEVIVGAPLYDSAGNDRGRVYLLRSVTSMLTQWTSSGAAAGDQLGTSVAAAGDIDRNGVPDAVAGAPFFGSLETGAVRVLSGSNGAQIGFAAGSDSFGLLGGAVAGLGDVDADGHADVAGGAPQENLVPGNGRVVVVSGKLGNVLLTIAGTGNEALGTALCGPGDLDGDGLADLVAGAARSNLVCSSSGAARSTSMRAAGVSFFGASTNGCAGPQLLTTHGVPALGNAAFGFRSTQGPPSSLGLLLAANVADPAGADVFGIGVALHVDLLSSTEVYSFDLPTDASGYGALASPITNPSLVGLTFHLQSIFYWGGSCSLPPYALSGSQGLSIVVQ